MSWWMRMPYPYWMPPYPPSSFYPFYDIFSMLGSTLNWMIYPYYWMLYLESFRASFDIWKKVLENFAKYMSPPSTA